MKKEHTPGPWGFKPTATCNNNPCRWEILGGGGVIAETNDDTTDANARLIAAAPDLLQVVEDYLLLCQLHDYVGAVPDAARSAIAKAKGEA